jgi:hypothetical protein
MVSLAGIEPALTRLKRPPLNHSATGAWCGRKESNPRLGVRSAAFYSLNYAHLASPAGVEPASSRSENLARVRCATGMILATPGRIELPSTDRQSADLPLNYGAETGRAGRTRTGDGSLMRAPLWPLSYRTLSFSPPMSRTLVRAHGYDPWSARPQRGALPLSYTRQRNGRAGRIRTRDPPLPKRMLCAA